MAKAMYVGVGDKARKVKKAYIGVDNKARKVKKMYMGVDGKARCIFSGGEVSYYGTTEPLSVGREGPNAATVGNYALFAGGRLSGSYSGNVDAYSNSLIHTILESKNSNVWNRASAAVGNYALFAGGKHNTTSVSVISGVDAYDASLTKVTKSVYLNGSRYDLAGATVGNHALFAGGRYVGPVNFVDSFDASLTLNKITALSKSRYQLAGAGNGKYALFAGGIYSAETTTTVDAYDASLTKVSVAALSEYAMCMSGAVAENRIVFACGNGSAYVVSYDASLVKTEASLPESRYGAGADSLNGLAIFAGGFGSGGYKNIVEAFDESLTRTNLTGLSISRAYIGAATVGEYLIIAGGKNYSDYIATAEVYQSA